MTDSIIQKTFIVGDTWLYYKIYCGVKIADTLLLNTIESLSKELLDKELIDKWFFIRYSDPDPHLRVRFHITEIDTIGAIIIKIRKLLSPYIHSKQIWNIQLATYQRELERYGTNIIEEAESFFFYDSEQILIIIQNSENDEARFLNVFKWIESILSLFKLNAQRQLSFLEKMQDQFKEEFRVHKVVKKELSRKYRRFQRLLFDETPQKTPNTMRLKPIVERFLVLEKECLLEVSLESLIASYIHMTINRSFRSNQRLQEMVLYDFLYRKNKSKFVRYGNS